MTTDTMTTLVEDNDMQQRASSPPASQQGEVPSGFILKLFQMVNGAPDEVISVSSPSFVACCNEYSSKFIQLCSHDCLVGSICMHALNDWDASLEI
jgi:hypothetical protein